MDCAFSLSLERRRNSGSILLPYLLLKILGAWVWRPNPYSFGSGAFYGLCIFIIFGAEAQQWEHLAPVPP
ncbi:hypothetical protein, partial [Okeania sp. SIO3I5]|uniref:hypothetical protein n=1 Tax=Okeania sp. SIO3I5 TaxID=2607805 RepID=UPI0025D4D95C